MHSQQGEHKTCLKCGHTRTPQDEGPDYACPRCDAVYAKVEALHRARQARLAEEDERRRQRIEREAWRREHPRQTLAQERGEWGRKALAHTTYALLMLPTGVTAPVGVVLAHAMKARADGCWTDSHFERQVSTFWRTFLLGLALWAMAWFTLSVTDALIGAPDLIKQMGTPASYAIALKIGSFALLGWYMVRLARGWLVLARGNAV
jgi:uncharacterized membrane protein